MQHDERDIPPTTPLSNAEAWARRFTALVDTARDMQTHELHDAQRERERLYQTLIDEHAQFEADGAALRLFIRSTPPSAELILIDIDGTDNATHATTAFGWLLGVLRNIYDGPRIRQQWKLHNEKVRELRSCIHEIVTLRQDFADYVSAHRTLVDSLRDCYAITDPTESALASVIRGSIRGDTWSNDTQKDLLSGLQYVPDAEFAHILLEWFATKAASVDVIRVLAWQTRNNPHPQSAEKHLDFLRRFGPTLHETPSADYCPTRWSRVDCSYITSPLPANVTYHHSYDALRNHTSSSVAESYTAQSSITFLQNTTKHNIGAPSEDVLLSALHKNTLLAIVADGVSQSALGEIAAQQFTEQVYRQWHALEPISFTSHTVVEELVIPAAWVAFHTTRALVAETITAIPDPVMRRIIERDNSDAGSQSTFALAIYDGKKVILCWMGNTRILVHRCRDRTRMARRLQLPSTLAHAVHSERRKFLERPYPI